MPTAKRIYDISQPVSPETGHWPGDTPFQAEFTWSLSRGDSCNVSRVVTSPHVGSHADAPLHFSADGLGIGEVGLDPYIGPCWLLEGPREGQVQPEHLRGIDLTTYPRVLVRTRDDDEVGFCQQFVSLAPGTAELLREKRAKLIGLDTPSMDPFESQDLPVHHALLGARIALLENLQLAGIPDGSYELIALPLRWPGLDASPVRAVLRELD